jgi:hypothetical protein
MYHDQGPYHPQGGSNVHMGEHDIMHHPNGQLVYHGHAHDHSHIRGQSSHAAGDDGVENGVGDGGVDEVPAKKKRKKVSHACLYCRRSHMVCDEGRPCQRWYALLSICSTYVAK